MKRLLIVFDQRFKSGPMTYNEKFEELLGQEGVEEPYMSRHSYVLENSEGKFLLVRSREAGFPNPTFGNQRQLLSDSIFYCDMFDVDLKEIAVSCINSYTSLDIDRSELKLFAYSVYSSEVAYYSDQIGAATTDDALRTSNADFINLFYHVKLRVQDLPEFWGEYHSEHLWAELSEARSLIEVGHDLSILQNLNTKPTDLVEP